ncbi:MAG TPA: hypothetical protein VFS30_13930 [Dehalococcoidia bacterium]|nr:hypothetical protein [Dehalococcoidia bacterium]
MRVGLFGLVMLLAVASAGTLDGWSRSAEAGKPELVIGDISITDTENCIVAVNWSGLKGGRELEVVTRLLDASGDPLSGSTKNRLARYDVGQVVFDFGDVTGVAEVVVTFNDHKLQMMDSRTVSDTCS